MESFNSKAFYGYSHSGEPGLSLNMRNSEFKYNTFNYERPTKTVKKDRPKRRTFREYTKTRQFLSRREPEDPDCPQQTQRTQLIETEIGRMNSHSTVIRSMTDDELQSLFSQTMSDIPFVPVKAEKTPKQKKPSVRSIEELIKHEDPFQNISRSYIVPWPKTPKSRRRKLPSPKCA